MTHRYFRRKDAYLSKAQKIKRKTKKTTNKTWKLVQATCMEPSSVTVTATAQTGRNTSFKWTSFNIQYKTLI